MGEVIAEEGSGKPALAVSSLTVAYGATLAVEDAELTVERGTVCGIVGPNGSGKTTLLKGMLGLVRPLSGEVWFDGKPLPAVRRDLAYVPQRKEIDWDFPITVVRMALMGVYPRLGYFRRPSAQQLEWVSHCLERVGMEDYADRSVNELSGGQQQRVFMARALVQRPVYLFLDEPFAGVDLGSQETILTVLQDLRSQGVSTVVVHHDLQQVADYFDRVVLLDRRIVSAGNPREVLTPGRIAETYSTATVVGLKPVGGGSS